MAGLDDGLWLLQNAQVFQRVAAHQHQVGHFAGLDAAVIIRDAQGPGGVDGGGAQHGGVAQARLVHQGQLPVGGRARRHVHGAAVGAERQRHAFFVEALDDVHQVIEHLAVPFGLPGIGL